MRRQRVSTGTAVAAYAGSKILCSSVEKRGEGRAEEHGGVSRLDGAAHSGSQAVPPEKRVECSSRSNAANQVAGVHGSAAARGGLGNPSSVCRQPAAGDACSPLVLQSRSTAERFPPGAAPPLRPPHRRRRRRRDRELLAHRRDDTSPASVVVAMRHTYLQQCCALPLRQCDGADPSIGDAQSRSGEDGGERAGSRQRGDLRSSARRAAPAPTACGAHVAQLYTSAASYIG